MTPHVSPSEWGDRYDEIRPTYRAFVDQLETLLETLLDQEDTHYEWAVSWAETTSSFTDRLYRARQSGRPVAEPLSEWSDFAGVSIVVRTLDELQPILSLVEREFDVDQEASHPFSEWAEADEPCFLDDERRLGYGFPYLIVKLSEGRSVLPEWRGYSELSVKVETMTRLQDAWDDIDRGILPYYKDSSYPVDARRRIEDAVHHFIEADRALAEVWPDLWRVDHEYESAVESNGLDLPLDARSLACYLRASGTVRELVRAAERAGLPPDDSEADGSDVEEYYLWLLARNSIDSIEQLDTLLRSAADRAPDILMNLARPVREQGGEIWANSWVVWYLLLVLTRADSETLELAPLWKPIVDALNTLIGNPVERRRAE